MLCCAYKYGLVTCVLGRRSSTSGIDSKFCEKHHIEATRKRKRNTDRTKAKTLTKEKLLERQKKVKSESIQRTSAYRKRRKADLESILDEKIKSISTILDTIKTNQHYVVIPNVISKILTIDDIVLCGEIEPIDFTNVTGPVTRTMQAITNAKDFMPETIEALKRVFPECTEMEFKLLRSVAGDTQQRLHEDFTSTASTKRMQNLKGFHYSGIISLQNYTKLIVGENKELYNIARSSMLFFRGDMSHAGASYNELNERIFISISSHAFPVSDDVVLN